MPTSKDQMTLPRYMGVPTFMRTPYQADPAGLDIALIGVPYDGAVTNRAGARHGPREIRNQSSLMRSIHHVSRINPYALCKIADIGDVAFEEVYDHRAVVREIEAFYARVHDAGAVPLSAGGDHSVTYPILKGIVRNGPVGLIHIDAHTDTWDAFQGSKFMHGTPFRRAHEDGLIDADRTVQIGIRGAQNTSDGWDYSIGQGMRVIFMEEFTRMGVEAVVEEARSIVGDRPAYLSFDVDGLDPVYAPGTGTPEIGGITTIEALALLRGLRNLHLIGADVVEVAPPLDPSGNTALVGATLMYEMLCLLSEGMAAKER
jgi:guanidinopropionase